ncbi:MAG: hypothetical protein KF782_12885 [Labilithrix sp.]|nr:hypothetical protein [Labilithrix sp.]
MPDSLRDKGPRRAHCPRPGGLIALASVASAGRVHAAHFLDVLEQGYELGEVQHPRSVALAGAQQVWGGSTTAVFIAHNLSLYRVYPRRARGVQSRARRRALRRRGRRLGTKPSGGQLWRHVVADGPDGIRRQWTDLRLALAHPLGDRFHLGATGRYMRVNRGHHAVQSLLSLASRAGRRRSRSSAGSTFDAGAAVAITEQLRFAVSGRNLGSGHRPLAARSGGAALGWSNQTVTAEANTLVDFDVRRRADAHDGRRRVLLADRVPLRAQATARHET